MSQIVILKSNGDEEFFDESKLVRSLKKAKATDAEIEHVVQYVKSKLHKDISTLDIYGMAKRALLSYQKRNPNSIRYSLKQSVMELGPSGFPFEQFVARMYVEMGYQCQVGVMVQGNCIQHEVDILAHNDMEVICIEAKFHNESYMKSDTKVALYVKSRFDDLIGQPIIVNNISKIITKGILVTNTNFTDSARHYVECKNTFELLSWNKPVESSMLDRIEKYKLYPITVIPDLTKKEVTMMLENGLVVCSDIHARPQILKELGIKPQRQTAILQTINQICVHAD